MRYLSHLLATSGLSIYFLFERNFCLIDKKKKLTKAVKLNPVTKNNSLVSLFLILLYKLCWWI